MSEVVIGRVDSITAVLFALRLGVNECHFTLQEALCGRLATLMLQMDVEELRIDQPDVAVNIEVLAPEDVVEWTRARLTAPVTIIPILTTVGQWTAAIVLGVNDWPRFQPVIACCHIPGTELDLEPLRFALEAELNHRGRLGKLRYQCVVTELPEVAAVTAYGGAYNGAYMSSFVHDALVDLHRFEALTRAVAAYATLQPMPKKFHDGS